MVQVEKNGEAEKLQFGVPNLLELIATVLVSIGLRRTITACAEKMYGSFAKERLGVKLVSPEPGEEETWLKRVENSPLL